jgi:DNA processing protein
MPLEHWLQLSLTEGIGPILQKRLIEAAGDAAGACAANPATLKSVEGIGLAKSQQLHDALRRSADLVEPEIARARNAGAQLLCPEDPGYPQLLREIPDPPAVIYLRGTLEPRDLNAIAIVGSRLCTHYGREQAQRMAELLASAGFTVVSGGARGIDSSAHRGAIIPAQGRTIAVLGSGVDVAYPPENASLFDQIAKHGAVVSEYPIATPPLKDNFPRRNRIISGLSRGVLVIEADERSGALITARQACDDHGRPVFALPGRVDSRMSAGPHKLIRDGAVLVTSLADILEGLGPLPQAAIEATPALASGSVESAAVATMQPMSSTSSQPIPLSEQQQKILQHLDGDPLDVDSIIERTAMPAQLVLQELTFLSLRGIVRRVDGQAFVKRN